MSTSPILLFCSSTLWLPWPSHHPHSLDSIALLVHQLEKQKTNSSLFSLLLLTSYSMFSTGIEFLLKRKPHQDTPLPQVT
jgi:hypothetical protein